MQFKAQAESASGLYQSDECEMVSMGIRNRMGILCDVKYRILERAWRAERCEWIAKIGELGQDRGC